MPNTSKKIKNSSQTDKISTSSRMREIMTPKQQGTVSRAAIRKAIREVMKNRKNLYEK